jgi:predicted component of type VI protein secretion system
MDVSRHHCLLAIDPPRVWVRDLGSLNGTFVNGEKISLRDPDQKMDGPGPEAPPGRELADGDEVSLGRWVAFRVHVGGPEEAAAQPARRKRGLARILAALTEHSRGAPDGWGSA